MAAKVDTRFSRGFFLTEEALTKIEELTRTRLGSAGDYSQEYHVHRIDDVVATYSRASEVISNEENSKRNAVTELEFEAASEHGNLRLAFEKGEQTKLTIASSDRDRALLLSSDIKDYLKGEVLVRPFASLSSALSSRLAYPLAFMLAMFPMFLWTWWNRPPNVDLSNATDSQKIDFLVVSSNARQQIDAPMYMFIAFIVLIILITVGSSSRVYPAYTFYWGKEIPRYDSAKSLRGKVFWGIIVALVVGLLASVLANRV